ncbi:amino acid/amide ABC transporter membrane protein 2, HAAT family (TC 3.A.1.4.-) [Desulfonatronum thiosulfatophilum]|uniref:Amino acid/amide ABC transporter membrane protein 2, HAAT family (TC 3.A.1.4.-) n=1 Tax=Desulfonatronum thiosulfatophilum TaxID=617002 RepID=A0A1G6E1D0_9BACT|nr:branched-chain amino acid ABC transporter permease [Desulfonatronum thiosulfatophilum]SDB51188.1 amino acid/amide ABC transporter membrane protein 2, HAAT family (TC 3.A.1.4.-) [Desulfonatronum thiosulfatophilum]
MQRFTMPILLAALFAGLIGMSQGGMIDLYIQTVIMFMGINIILSSSLNIVNGYMGEFSCGHAGFMAVGAYVSSLLSVWLLTDDRVFGPAVLSPELALVIFPLCLLGGAVAAALAGLLVAIPSFKTRDDYLAIITIASLYIIKSTIENISAIGGPRGFMGMRSVVVFMEDVIELPWMLIWIFISTVFTIWIIRRFVSSTYGKGIIAVRQDEVAAEIMSVNTNKMKVVAFMLSSGLAGLAGGLFAHVLGYVNPGAFGILKTTEIMVMVYLGGMGSLTGSVLSAVLFTVLMEAMRPLQIIKWVIVPLMLIILMHFRPEGIMGNRELSDIFPRLRRWFQFK